MIEVVSPLKQGQVVLLHHIGSIGEEEVRVGLEVDDAAIDEELAIAIHEPGGREALAWVLHLRVGEGKPYLLHLARSEEALDDLDVGAQEGYILQSLVEGLCGPSPHTGSLDIDTDEVHVGVELGQLYGVFTLATTQLQNDGVLVVEVLLVPVTLHIKRNMLHYRVRVLEHVLISLHVGEFRQLAFSH